MAKQEVIELALKEIFSGIARLREAQPKKEFTIDGRLVGDIGETIVERDYELFLYTGLEKDYDGETPSGRKVQIKATFKDSLTFKKISDYYLGIKIFNDGSYEEIFNGPGSYIVEEYSHRKDFGEKLLSFPNKRLTELSSKVLESERVRKRV
ncbi:hypothetical protein ABXV18_06285 [Vibrio owensii]|uniref:DUF6998 domain-containing protein n=1 Tax=Vibrio owensii TaxID=696485 RepID=UPI0033940887